MTALSKLWKPPLGSRINRGHPLAKGLMAAWLFNEGGGTKAMDSNGIYVGTLTSFGMSSTSGWNPGKFGTSLLFDGTDDYVSTLFKNIGGLTGISMGTWMKTTSTARSVAMGSYDGVGHDLLSLDINRGATIPSAGRLYFALRDSTGAGLEGYTTNTNTFNNGNWHHVFATFNITTKALAIYFDGVPVAVTLIASTIGATSSNLTFPFLIGALNGIGTPNTFYPGNLDQVLIYNRVLTPNEVWRLYSQPFGFIQQPRRKIIRQSSIRPWWLYATQQVIDGYS